MYPLTPQTLSSPSGLLGHGHQDLPLLHLYFCSPLGESTDSKRGSILRKQEDVEYSSEVSSEILAVSSLWHSGSLEKVMELKGESRNEITSVEYEAESRKS